MKPCQSHTARDWPGNVTADRRGRLRVFLGKGHPAANSGGWQWVPRFLVWEATGEVLRPDEHVHHVCTRLWCCEPEHYEVGLAEYHGRLHATFTVLRDGAGRFAERAEPLQLPEIRFGAIIGRAALEHMDR